MTGPESPNQAQAAQKSQNQEKRCFSLPYISHNVHYTKYIRFKKEEPPYPAFRDFGQALFLFVVSVLFAASAVPCRTFPKMMQKSFKIPEAA